MSTDPKPEHRISNLEKEFLHLGTRIEEAASDNAEEFKAVRQDIRQLDQDVKASYEAIGDTFIALGKDLDTVMATMATKEDISRLETAMATKDDISRLESDISSIKDTQEQILKLLQQKSGE